MRIVSLEASNIKRLKAVSITPDGNTVTIGGKNRAGKSSVLDAIAYALGGQDLIPEEPIRHGETKAEVKVDLGDFLVIRKFYRDVTTDEASGTTVVGPTKSSLSVKSKDNATYASPQSMLDKLLGKLTFDPRAFATAKPKEQLDTLRRITNLDVSMFDSQRKEAVARRTALKKEVDQATFKLNAMVPFTPNVPLEEQDLTDVLNEVARIEALRTIASTKQSAAEQVRGRLGTIKSNLNDIRQTIDSLETQLAKAKEQEAKLLTDFNDTTDKLKQAVAEYQSAVDAVPSIDTVNDKLAEAQALNITIRHNKAYLEQQKVIEELKAKVDEESDLIKELDARKEAAIAAVKFPVEGLGFGEDGVIYNGLPFEQASTSEQLSVSVAIGLALNPKIRVLLVRNGECLDSASMKILAELAEKHDAQLWVERMTESKDGAAVMIEDGEIVA